MACEQEDNPKLQFPLDSNSYKITEEIGGGVSAVVYKAECVPLNSTVVAIKAIDLDQSEADFDNLRRETKTMSLLSHPNILNAHCSFTVDRRIWVIMPFMSGGSLRSIISSSVPDGLPEQCIAIILKETLKALSYLLNQGHSHRDIKAGNILLDSNGCVKLADFGVSALVYESSSGYGLGSSTSSSPYWIAPEVIHSHTGYSFKADIWSFGLTALVSTKKFSEAFEDMVASCLDEDPAKRPSADELLKHPFFESCKGSEFLVKHLLHGLPSVEERFRASKILRKGVDVEVDDHDPDGASASDDQLVKHLISGWNFNEDGFELDPVFQGESSQDDSVAKQVRFDGETMIRESAGDNDGSHGEEQQSAGGIEEITVNAETMVSGLMTLKKRLDNQSEKVTDFINLFGVEEINREDQLVELIERLKLELENERTKNFELQMELEFLKILISYASNTDENN